MILPGSLKTNRKAAALIARGGVIAFRTDTFYGLGVDPFNRDAVARIKQLKGREDHKPILIVISDREQVHRFINETSAAFNHLTRTFWPGALTLVGRANADVPKEITAGSDTVGVRLPNDERVRALVEACGGALTATSANPSQAAPAGNAQAVRKYFGDSIDLIIDDGEAKTDRPSTVVDVSGSKPVLIREGVVPWGEIEDEL
ncbi:MAG TPA: L-threonylcarbamoyladenylate synthase [Pyrinomonadaceae bacterium]|nr:L-threonylcarbamoyladenylate synthase [Pyrinomonadaceae bacterium]